MKSLKRLADLVKAYTGQIILAALMLLALTSIDMIFPEIIRRVIDIGVRGNQPNYMAMAAGFIIGLGLLMRFSGSGDS